MRRQGWIGVAIAASLCFVILILGWWSGFFSLDLLQKIALVRSRIEVWGAWAPVAYILVYIFRPLMFLPATPVAILGGVFFGGIAGIIYILAGTMLSSMIEFIIVRYFIGEKAKQFFREKAGGVSRVSKQHGFFMVFLVRLIPNVAFDLQNCGLALTPVKFSDFFFGTLLGCLPACIVYTSIGSLAFNFLGRP